MAASAFDLETDVPSVAGGGARLTLVHGSTFCVSEATGDLDPTLPEGLFHQDRRVLSSLRLLLDGLPLEPLVAHALDPFAGVFVGRGRSLPGHADSGLVVRRDRWIGDGLREDITVTNYRDVRAAGLLTVRLGADFADLFDIKTGAPPPTGSAVTVEDGQVLLVSADGRRATGVRLHGFAPPTGPEVQVVLDLPPGGRWAGCVEVSLVTRGRPIRLLFPCGTPVAAGRPASELFEWRRRAAVVRSEPPAMERVVWRSREDLGALRMHDALHPGETTIAAGAPWYMTLFGRDSLLTSWSALLVDPTLATGTLRALARMQGTRVVPATEEQPGRILHEVRHGEQGPEVYYGTVDATPLFVMLLGEVARWGQSPSDVDDLLPHADRALEWMTTWGDPDGDGFLEHERMTPDGLRNQGWKDSWDGVRDAAGRLATGPVALAEVQGYAYAAYLARTHLAVAAGDAGTAATWRARAARLRDAFDAAFWLPDRGWYAMGLDGDGRPLDALTSSVGHCLWTGIARPDRAAALAERLLRPDVFSGWGLRTLATSMAGFNPVSYHNGSVWPHDTALVAAGLMRYGHVDASLRLVAALLDAAAAFSERLPELYGGLDRSELPVPLTYPASCSPQAWAAAAPLLLLRTVLRLDPAVPAGRVHVDPVLPPGTRSLHVEGIPLGGARVDITVEGGEVDVRGLPPDVVLDRRPRHPLTALLDQ
ncbi:MAG: amylo-alpha-1,6-glucosidase [Frankiales bacterium]|nr:MAG: amylo-alpha-1,6-glucosidase [Frankiales bacterium]